MSRASRAGSKAKKAKFGLTLNLEASKSLKLFGNDIIKIYERAASYGSTKDCEVVCDLNETLSVPELLDDTPLKIKRGDTSATFQDVEMVSEDDLSSIDCEEVHLTGGDESVQASPKITLGVALSRMGLGQEKFKLDSSFKTKFNQLNALLPKDLNFKTAKQILGKHLKEKPTRTENLAPPTLESQLIKEIINSFTLEFQEGGHLRSIQLDNLLKLYLTKLAYSRQIYLPIAFLKIYKLYRQLHPLPDNCSVKIKQEDCELDAELWFTLTANEVEFQPKDSLFLLSALNIVKEYFAIKFKEFLIRLAIVLGVNKEPELLKSVALAYIEENAKIMASNKRIITRAYIGTLILDANKENDGDHSAIMDCMSSKEGKMNDQDIVILSKAIKSTQRWQQGLELLNKRDNLDNELILPTIATCLQKGAKMDAILASKLCGLALLSNKPIAWTCLYYGWIGQQPKTGSTQEHRHGMDKFFRLGHDHLARKKTCTSDQGDFLMLGLKHFLCQRDNELNMNTQEILRSLHCLFQFKPANFDLTLSHGVSRVLMTLDRCKIVYPYLMDSRYLSLEIGPSEQMISLFTEMAMVLVNNEWLPKKNIEIVNNYIDKGKKLIRIHFDPCLNSNNGSIQCDIFFHVAGYYYERGNYEQAEQYCIFDLAVDSVRPLSWWRLANIKLNSLNKALSNDAITEEYLVNSKFRFFAEPIMRCLEKSKTYCSKSPFLASIGSLALQLLPLSKQLIAYKDLQDLIEVNGDDSHRQKLVSEHKYICSVVHNRLDNDKNLLFYHYTLGKVNEKLDLARSMQYYLQVLAKLSSYKRRQNISYPKQISLANPPEFALELVEVYYRIHSSCIKFLLKTPNITWLQLQELNQLLPNSQCPLEVDDEKVLRDQILIQPVSNPTSEEMSEPKKRVEVEKLINRCLGVLQTCASICDGHFKAIYSMANYFFMIGEWHLANDILLDKTGISGWFDRVSAFTKKPIKSKQVPGLLKDRKNEDLFFNIHPIPVINLNRPSLLEKWMFKCTLLLTKVSIKLQNVDMLGEIAIQLAEAKEGIDHYLEEKGRLLLAQYAAKSVVDILSEKIDDLDGQSRYMQAKRSLYLVQRCAAVNILPEMMTQFQSKLQESLTK